MEPVSLAHIVTFFDDEIKLIGSGVNAFKSTRVEQFTFEGSTGIIRCKVRSSLKDITRFYVTYCCVCIVQAAIITQPITASPFWAHCPFLRLYE